VPDQQTDYYILAEEGFAGNMTQANGELTRLTLNKGIKYQLQLFYSRCNMHTIYQIFEPKTIAELCIPATVVKIKQ
jgi:hypothetical protein